MIAVKYTCDLCGLHRVTCSIEARKPGQDIAEWMGALGFALSRDHDKRSPGCKPEKLAEVMIPILDGQPMGSNAS